MADNQVEGCDLARLSAYRDGLLEASERQQVVAHLNVCESCQQVLHQYAQMSEALRQPVLLPHAAMAHADLQARLGSPNARPWPVRWLTGLGGVVSTVAASLVVAVGLAGLPVSERVSPLLPLVRAPSSSGGVVGVSTVGVAHGGLGAEGQAVEARDRRAVIDSGRCAQPLPGVVALLEERPSVQRTLGCATDAARMLGLISQRFERGDLVRRSDTREVYAIIVDGRWLPVTPPGIAAPPAHQARPALGGVEPGARLEEGAVDRSELRRRLGQAIGDSVHQPGLVQPYEGGLALWDSRGEAYLLLKNGQSLRFSAVTEQGGQLREQAVTEPEVGAVQAPLTTAI